MESNTILFSPSEGSSVIKDESQDHIEEALDLNSDDSNDTSDEEEPSSAGE